MGTRSRSNRDRRRYHPRQATHKNYYLKPTPETDAMFKDGRFYPGDIGRISMWTAFSPSRHRLEWSSAVWRAPAVAEEQVARVEIVDLLGDARPGQTNLMGLAWLDASRAD